MTLLISGWAVSNYYTDNASRLEQNILFNKLAYLFALLAIVAAAIFTHYFANKKKYSSASSALALLGIAVLSWLSVSPHVAGAVTKEEGALVFKNGQLLYFYLVVITLLLGIIIRNLYGLLKNGSPLQKNQARIIISGFTFSILLGLAANAILPAILSNFQTAKYGPPLLSFFVIVSVTYAIVKHQLFDIRPIVARSFAYVLTLGSIAAAYSIIVFGIVSNFFDSRASGGQQVVYILFTIVAAFAFQPLRRRFDRLTNKVFFRDAYDPQELIDSLNNELVTRMDLEELLGQSARIIAQDIKAEFCQFILKETKHLPWLSLGTARKDTAEDTLKIMRQLSGKLRREIIFSADTRDYDLSKSLTGLSIAVVVKLRTHSGLLGYLVLGDKKSGNAYSRQDVKMLSILSGELAIAIQNSLRFEEIKQFNITLEQKVSEATKELRKANIRLKQLDHTKDEFISMASHQLRTPLTTIKGYLSMVLEGEAGPVTKEERDMVRKAFDSAERMVYLIADLLNVSRLQSGKFVIENKPTDLAEMVAAEVGQLQESARNHGVSLTFDRPAKFPLTNIDENKIRQVIMNFIDNAIYYTPSGGKITAALEATDEAINFTVTDTGLGVPKDEQSHLFSKFYRADNARKARPDGTGLGLFMAKKVIVAEGGAIIFRSTEGKGSTFGFTFPRKLVEKKA